MEPGALGGLDPSERVTVLGHPALEWAREFVVQAVIAPGADALGGRAGRDGDLLRRAARLLERIGWPGAPETTVTLGPADAGLIRLAAYATMRQGAQDVEEGVDLDEPGTVDAVRRAVGLLDEVGWRGDEPPVEAGSGWRSNAIDDAERMLAAGAEGLVVCDRGVVVHARIPWRPDGDHVGRRLPHPGWPVEGTSANLAALLGGEPAERVRVTATAVVTNGITIVTLREEGGRARLREALVRGGERFRAIVDAAPVSLTFVDTEGDVVWINETTARFFGADLPAFEKDPLVMVHPDDHDTLTGAVAAAMAEQRSVELEYRFLRDGRIRHTMLAGNPLFGIDGAYLGHVIAGWDITHRKDLERDLAYETAIRSACAQVAEDAYLVTDDTGVITTVTAGICDLTAFAETELVGSRIPHPFWSDDLLRQHRSVLGPDVDGGRMPDAALESFVRRPDGGLVPVVITTRAALSGDRVVGYVTAMARRAEDAE